MPFDAIAKKARGLVAARKKEKKREESECFSGIASKGSKKEPVPLAETLAIEDGPVVAENPIWLTVPRWRKPLRS